MPAPVDSHSGRRGARPRSAFKDQSSQASTRRRPPCANGSPGNGPRSLGGSLAARRARTPTAGSPGSWTPAAGGTAHPPVTQAPNICFSRTRSSPPVQITPPSSGPPGWRGAQLLVVLPRRHLRAVHEATPQVGRHGPPAVSARAGVRSGRSRVVRPQGVRTQLLRQPRDWREGPVPELAVAIGVVPQLLQGPLPWCATCGGGDGRRGARRAPPPCPPMCARLPTGPRIETRHRRADPRVPLVDPATVP